MPPGIGYDPNMLAMLMQRQGNPVQQAMSQRKQMMMNDPSMMGQRQAPASPGMMNTPPSPMGGVLGGMMGGMGSGMGGILQRLVGAQQRGMPQDRGIGKGLGAMAGQPGMQEGRGMRQPGTMGADQSIIQSLQGIRQMGGMGTPAMPQPGMRQPGDPAMLQRLMGMVRR